MTKMHRQSLVAYGQPLCETVVDCPAPRGSEVLVRVERCGVCHSDLHLQDGYFLLGGEKRLDVTAGRTLPFTLGHEIAGVIEATGGEADGSDHWPPGRGLSLDRLRHLRGVPRWRGEFVLLRLAISASPSMADLPPMCSSRIRATCSIMLRCPRALPGR